ncbi:histidinol-phosphate aminotransferase family protein [Tenacibaculum aiptasiae]|uniref:Histidinol-phosphate aminotransferase family protein n=1 Tax=Tenacibaculum aiptasiae TaxID=426481 RepID=A0A7J5A6X0_9FLAO|nr:histidinol-phosphate transaminase [Tenacibaculum aiptasiae]KAB1153278.1 histidinol-phosphate aminotransferase family protein [Tenacibaculum aiptasiae]
MEKKDRIKGEFLRLKKQSGTHSPSIKTLLEEIPELDIKIDACFLSNPYATDLFLNYLEKDFPTYSDLRDCLEFYPPQNSDIAKIIGNTIDVSMENIFVGNGAIEIISAVLSNYCGKKIMLPIPTFSSYYEFIKEDQEIVFHELSELNNYELDVENLKEDLLNKKADSLILINPNNPNGDYLNREKVIDLLEFCKNLDCVILDESFVHFAYESDDLDLMNYYDLINTYNNLVIIKSMSKDFGIAGVRAGYGIMSKERVENLTKSSYLWNISGLASYFFDLYSQKKFREEYDVVRKKYIMNTLMFRSELSGIKGIKIYPSKANFFLIKVENDLDGNFGLNMLINHGVYVRNCSDKVGLEGSGYYRVASRTFEENINIIKAIKIELS